MNLFKFTAYFLVYVGVLLTVIASLLEFTSFEGVLVKNFWAIFAFNAGLTYISYTLCYLGNKRNPDVGISAIIGAVSMKIVFSGAFVLVLRENDHEMDLKFALVFFSLYLLFLAFEMYCLLRNLRHQK